MLLTTCRRILLAGMLSLVAAPRTESRAKEEKPATQPAGNTSYDQLTGGPVEFLAPVGWIESVKSRRPTTAAYVSKPHDGLIAVQVLPADAGIDKAAAGSIIKQLIEKRKKAKQEVILEPKVEADAHYDLTIHEKYRSPGEKVADTYYLYRKVGTLIVLTTVSSLSDGEAGKQIHATGDGVAQSVRMVKPPARSGKGK